MARKKIREYDSKRLLKEHFKRMSGSELEIKSAQVTESTNFEELVDKEVWISSTKLVVKPDMLFGKRGKSGLVALNLDLAGVASFVKDRLGKEVEMGGCKGPITTFIVEPFVPHDEEYYLNIVSERLGCSISFSECGGIEIEENWDKVKTVFVPTGASLTSELCAPLVATLPLEVGDLGYASELGNYAEYSGAPNEEEVLQYARVVIDCATADPDGRKRALVIGGGIANFTDVAATFSGIIRALREKEAKLKAARMHLYVRRGGPNYQKGLEKMRSLADEIGIPIEVYGPEATMTGICKQAIECISAAA
ncbi:succinyl-CoA ligase [ADP-forming] subunit beta [Striga asiatica]|uniref:ATP citrate synthase n=1 Tax=Striga asiatica TaxID=4170 RepID=A0A5A7QXU4_STRAF|nr:succinyl-CoA ligase [ADP-forming] subunit beta [Striga asiatica]